jgi:hypothetical protein
LAHGEQVLREAGIAVGQIVLASAGEPPDNLVEIAATDTLRSVVPVDGGLADAWQDFTDAYQAEVHNTADTQAIADALLRRAAQQSREGLPGSYIDLQPWLIGLAMLAWLLLFRRIVLPWRLS